MNLIQEKFLNFDKFSWERKHIKGFPPLPNLGIPLINYYHDEALGCLEAGLDYAAIIVTSTLLEVSLRILLISHDIGNGNDPWSSMEKWKKVVLHNLIEGLLKKGIISKELANDLKQKKQKIRNVFHHGNLPEIDIKTIKNDETRDMAVMSLFLYAQPIGLMKQVSELSFEWFLFVDRNLRNRIPWGQISLVFGGELQNIPFGDEKISVGKASNRALSKSRNIIGKPIHENK